MKAIQLQRYDEISFNNWLSENIFEDEDGDPFSRNFFLAYCEIYSIEVHDGREMEATK